MHDILTTWGDPSAALAPEVLGYSHNNGGLTNQKLALFGLFFKAHKLQLPVVLPNMLSKNYVTKKHSLVPIHNVYKVEKLADFANRYNILILPHDAGIAPNWRASWEFFEQGASLMARVATSGRPGTAEADFAFDFFAALTPHLRSSPILARLRRAAFHLFDIKVTAQFRIEIDWVKHCAMTLGPTIKTDEEYALSFGQIVSKIMRTLPNTRKIMVFCDESALPVTKLEMCDYCFRRFGVELFWKSDFLGGDELRSLNQLELSLIDFELAVASRHYVGLSRSTFSNMVTFEKYMARGHKVTSDYIYNCAGPDLGQRTDNGGQIRPLAATAYRSRLRLAAPNEQDCQWRVFIKAHISNVGDVDAERAHMASEADVPASAGILGDATRLIEGFSVIFPETLDGGLEYCAILANGDAGPWISQGGYAGTRGKGQALRGFAARLTGTLARSHDCICIGSFLEGKSMVTTRNGETCRSPEGKQLAALQIVFRRANAALRTSATPQFAPATGAMPLIEAEPALSLHA